MTYSANGTNLENIFESRDGAPLNDGWQTDSLSDWYGTGAGWSVVTPSDAPVSSTCLQFFGPTEQILLSERFPADPNKTYRVSGWFRQIGSATNQYLLVGFYNSAGSLITNQTNPNNGTGLNWPAVGTYNYHSVINTSFPNGWTFYSFEFGDLASAKIPPTATDMVIGALLSWNSSTSEIIQINSYRIEEVNDSAPLPDTVTNYFEDGTNFSQIYQPISHDSRIPDIDYFVNGTSLSRLYKGNISQYSIAAKAQSARTSAWNGIVDASCQVSFANTTARNNFFVFGGRILISASRSGGSSSAKNNEWTAILNTAGRTEVANTISLRNTQSIVSSIGNTDLTTSFQQLYATSGGSYTNASYSVAARIISDTVVEVSVQLTDGASGVIDENIDGTLQIFFGERRHPDQSSPSFTISNNI